MPIEDEIVDGESGQVQDTKTRLNSGILIKITRGEDKDIDENLWHNLIRKAFYFRSVFQSFEN